MQNPISGHIRSNIVGYIALFLFAMGGSAYALDGPLPGQNQVGSSDIINGEVKAGDLGANSIATTKILDHTVGNADLAPSAVNSATIADGAIQGTDVKNGTLGIPNLAFDPATQAELDSTKSDLSSSDGSGPNTGSNRVHWDVLTGVPAGFADGVDNGGSTGWSLSGNSGTTAANFLGTTDNQPLNLRTNNARGLRIEPASDGTNQSPNVIGGIADNSVTPGVNSATIGGGGRGDPSDAATGNRVTDDQGTVGGGANNQAGDGAGTVSDRPGATVGGGLGNTAGGERATIGGGIFNTANGSRSTVAGGQFNGASGNGATVAGGNSNGASGDRGTVGGGNGNLAGGQESTVGGGSGNHANGDWATVAGGNSNTAQGDLSLAAGLGAQANHDGAFVWGDSNPFFFSSTAQNQFNVRSTGGVRLVSGIDGTGSPTTGLELPAGTSGWSTLVNGQPFDIRVNGARAFRVDPASDGTNPSPNLISGSPDNFVTPGVHGATIGGGSRGNPALPTTANRVTDDQGTIGGGANNQAGDDAGTTTDRTQATVSGGWGNRALGLRSTVGGGFTNAAGGDKATVGGGQSNSASTVNATVAGGIQNTAGGIQASTVGGGAGNQATGQFATIGGGRDNAAAGVDATVPGGNQNSAAGNSSLAAGNRAKANQHGAFVWADSNNFDFFATAQDQFSVRATGGARFVSGIDSTTGNPTTGVQLAPNNGSWSSLSDRASKEAIRAASGRRILRKLSSVPVSTWRYRGQKDSIRHIGPMAQDFYRAFGVGEDRRHIDSVDADGVALAAIKGLSNQLRVERRQRHHQQERLDRLEARVAALERSGGGQ